MIIDAHVNITHNGKWFKTNYDASLERLFGEMEEANIEKCLLIAMPLATTNTYIASVVEKYPDKFRGLGHLDFSQGLKKQVDEIIAMGLSGIKIHPRMQNVNLCDNIYDSLWKYLDTKSIRVLVDGYYQVSASTMLIQQLLPLAYERHIRTYKNVTFILAHAGCHRVMDSFFLCRSYKNFYCDLSYSINIFQNTSFYQDYRFLIQHTDQKVLFGSDFPEITLSNARRSYEILAKECLEEKGRNVSGQNAYTLFWKKNAT
jgi:predicted TIM-barrel fold metal-dependent hydrolase